jgi:hypothetical protein
MNTETNTTETAVDNRPREAKMTALEFMRELSYRYVSDSALRARYGYGMVFRGGSTARFANIAGLVNGLAMAGQKELASRLAEDLDSGMQRLASFARRHEFAVEGEFVNAWESKVIVGDDGTFGGFTFAVMSGIPNERLNESERERCDAELADWISIKDVSGEYVKDFGGYHKQAKVQYRFAFNGGLLYHGPGGGEVFAVTMDNSRFWSIHT